MVLELFSSYEVLENFDRKVENLRTSSTKCHRIKTSKARKTYLEKDFERIKQVSLHL